MKVAGISYLRRVPAPEGKQAFTGHYVGCPDTEHTHHLLVPYPNITGGQVNLSTQAGFALYGREDLAIHWGDPWFLTIEL